MPQISLVCHVSEDSGLPCFYVTCPGSIVDKSHLSYMMAYIVSSEIGVKLGDFMRRRRIGKAGLFREMDKINTGLDAKGWRLLNPLAKTQRTIMESMGLTENDLGAYLARA